VDSQRIQIRFRLEHDTHWIDSSSRGIRPYGVALKLSNKAVNKRWRVPTPDMASGNRQRHDASPSPGSSAMAKDNDSNSTTSSSVSTRQRQIQAMSDMFRQYVTALATWSYSIKDVMGDGNCLFRAVAHQVYGDEEEHAVVRDRCCTYMETHRTFFSDFVEGGDDAFDEYIRWKREDACWGDDPEIQALCEMYNRPAEIWAYDRRLGAKRLRTFHEGTGGGVSSSSGGGGGESPIPMRLSYYGGGHYDSIMGRDFDGDGLRAVGPSGTIEDAAIRRSRIRTTTPAPPSSSSSSSSSSSPFRSSQGLIASEGEPEARRASDFEATEQAALDAALEVSRNDARCWGEDDLQECLRLSLATAAGGADAASDGRVYSERGGEAKDAKMEGTIGTGTSTGTGAGNELHAVEEREVLQMELQRSIEEQSEREYIQKALEDSMMAESKTSHSSSSPYSASAVVGGPRAAQGVDLSKLTDDEQLELALKQSMDDQGQGWEQVHDPFQFMDEDEDEDAMLQAAIAASRGWT
jgi:hypothetical protein